MYKEPFLAWGLQGCSGNWSGTARGHKMESSKSWNTTTTQISKAGTSEKSSKMWPMAPGNTQQTWPMSRFLSSGPCEQSSHGCLPEPWLSPPLLRGTRKGSRMSQGSNSSRGYIGIMYPYQRATKLDIRGGLV